MSAPSAKPVYRVSVRELVEFVWRRGDLVGEAEFVGSNRALAGIRGHQQIQRSRPPGYRTEVSVEHTVEVAELRLEIRGRLDGLFPPALAVVLEEIKTVQGRWNEEADPLHWAQIKCYGFMHAHAQGSPRLDLQLVYLDLVTGGVREFRQKFSFGELANFFATTAAAYVDWLREEQAWREARNASVAALSFPFAAYRPGQRQLAVAAYRVLSTGGRLFLTAPTGIGKTLATLFPAVKALGAGKLERIYYLTARTVARGLAEQALAALRGKGLKLRAVTLTAREKVCVRDGQACNPLSCPLALGYYDRVKPALREALAAEAITREVLDSVGGRHQVCPHALALDVAHWVDVVIGDYNYVFDPRVYLRRHFDEAGGAYGFLVDEAHNLVDRGREMFSAELEDRDLPELKRALKTAVPRCAKALVKLHTALRQLCAPMRSGREDPVPSDPAAELALFPVRTASARDEDQATRSQPDLPEGLLPALATALAETERWLARNEPAEFRERLLSFYFQMLAWQRTADLYDERFVTILESQPTLKVRLFCRDPSRLLREALGRGRAAIFFSATLAPLDYFRALLGGEPEDPVLQLASPFPPENLGVLVHDRIQTHRKGRADSLAQVVAAIGALVAGRRGNYLVYFPAYQYLNDALRAFQTRYPAVAVLAQRPGLSEAERGAFLASFQAESSETLVGFAVLGGIFGEGIDLVGERLIGAVIVGVGLPQLCAERDLIRDYFQSRGGAGFEFAYTFPGMNRVLQAAGRVIRSETDRGLVLLIDARFGEPRYRRLFPPWWQVVLVREEASLAAAVHRFWSPEG